MGEEDAKLEMQMRNFLREIEVQERFNSGFNTCRFEKATLM